MAEIKLEKGKFYRDGTGDKIEILTVSRPPDGRPYRCIGMSHSSGETYFYKLDGAFCAAPSDRHIISEWVDAPEVDWSLFSPWIVAVAMEPDGIWIEFPLIPRPMGYTWQMSVSGPTPVERFIPKEYAPKWTGQWQQSLVVRPGKGAK